MKVPERMEDLKVGQFVTIDRYRDVKIKQVISVRKTVKAADIWQGEVSTSNFSLLSFKSILGVFDTYSEAGDAARKVANIRSKHAQEELPFLDQLTKLRAKHKEELDKFWNET